MGILWLHKRLEDSGSESKRTQRMKVEIRLTKAVYLLCGYRQSAEMLIYVDGQIAKIVT